MSDLMAMVLAGGRVDDLSVLTLVRAKAALPFGGLYRIIDFPLSNLMHSISRCWYTFAISTGFTYRAHRGW